MTVKNRIARLAEWSDTLPGWVRPPLYGALFLLFMIGARGGLIGLPVLIVAVLVTSDHVARDLLMGVGILGAAVLGGAAAGTAYAIAH